MKALNKTLIAIICLSMTFVFSCSDSGEKDSGKSVGNLTKQALDPMDDVGIGPVKELTLPAEIDMAMAEDGKAVYNEMCTACHKADKKYIGPSPQGIFERRNPAWVMNMILNPEEMVEKNAIARKLLIAHNMSPMANQNLTEEQARAVVEYFRTL